MSEVEGVLSQLVDLAEACSAEDCQHRDGDWIAEWAKGRSPAKAAYGDFLDSLPESVLRKLQTIMYVGRDGETEFWELHEELRRRCPRNGVFAGFLEKRSRVA